MLRNGRFVYAARRDISRQSIQPASNAATTVRATVAAVAMGANLVERHVTLDRAMFGSDQSASVEPQGLKRLVRDIRVVEDAMGDGVKRVLPAESVVANKLRRVDTLKQEG